MLQIARFGLICSPGLAEEALSNLKRKLLFLPALGLGVVAFAVLRGCSEPPAQRPAQERAVPVRVITLPPLGIDLIPRVIGYGTAAARRQWICVAQVGGRIVQFNDRLRKGAFVPADTRLLSIDTTDYELESRRAQAQVASFEAQLDQLDEQALQYARQVSLERRSLELAQKELDRAESLAAQGIDAASDRDSRERELLKQENTLQQITDLLALLPTQRKQLEASRDAQQATLERAQLDIDRCQITAPYPIRVSSLDVELSQVVAPGQVLLRAEGTEFAEVAAQLPTQRFGPVIAGTEPWDVSTTPMDADLAELLSVTAIVRLRSGPLSTEWPARMVRVETIAPDTRTVPIVVEVAGPYVGVVPGRRPPLASGMYVEVELRGALQTGLTVIPRSALHVGGRIYVADGDSRLRSRPARILFEQGMLAAIDTQFEAGDRLIVSDPIPAVEGMLLGVVEDSSALLALQAEARGEGPVR